MLRTVDISKLASFVAPGVFRRIDPILEKNLLRYPETLERLGGVVHFCALMGHQTDDEMTSDSTQNRRKFLRAALSEYASLDEAATIDAAAAGTTAPKILALDDPRLHIVKLLRHANIHLAVSQIDRSSREATWKDQDFTFHIFYSPGIGSSIRGTDQAAKYRADDLSKMIEWIETEQMEWGLDHLVFKTSELYASNLLP
ncbi:MAG TPA: hypothetical protein VIM63_11745 [Rhodoferax sp.]